MKIVGLTVENVKRVELVEITPAGNTVIIGGKNEQGKSSCLDAIEYALGGGTMPAVPVHRGAKEGRVLVDLDDIIVERRFVADAKSQPQLVVKSRDGARYPTPQKLLDGLFGKLTFDPLEFTRMKPDKQLETLKGLVGLDFSAQDAKRKALYDERTMVNRDAKAAKANLDAAKRFPEAPAEEVSASTLLAELNAAKQKNTENQRQRDGLSRLESECQHENENIARVTASADADIKRCEHAVEAARRALTDAEEDLQMACEQKAKAIEQANAKANETAARVEKGKKVIAALKDVDTADLEARIAAVDETNAKVRANANHAVLAARVEQLETKSKGLSESIDSIDAEKDAAMAGAKFPVDGLSFGETGVLLKGLPFEQASSAERLRTSLAMGIAMNPKLRIMLIRDGSLLDNDSMVTIREMADAHDMQVWIERVGDDAEATVIIENGRVKQA
jgi:DNA repair exonuclease SbcCD ATPase subunit